MRLRLGEASFGTPNPHHDYMVSTMQLSPEERAVNTATMERRRAGRRQPFIDPTFVYVTLDSQELKAILVDESAGGLAIMVEELGPFRLNGKIGVAANDRRRQAHVVYIRSVPELGFRIGLAWDD